MLYILGKHNKLLKSEVSWKTIIFCLVKINVKLQGFLKGKKIKSNGKHSIAEQINVLENEYER